MEKKHYALNIWFIYLIAIIAFFVYSSVFFYRMDETGICILTAVGAVIFLINIFLEPCCYLFDKNEVVICHITGRKEKFLWKNIKTIREGYSPMFPHLDFIPRTTYEIEARTEDNKYVEGTIKKYPRTKRLLKKYWGEIETL